MQAKKEYIRALENAKGVILSDVDLNNPKEMKSLEETTNLVKINEEIKNLTKKKDDDEETRDGQPELPPILEEPADEEDQYASFITDGTASDSMIKHVDNLNHAIAHGLINEDGSVSNH